VEDVVYFLLTCFESHEVIIDYSNTFIDTIVPQVKHAIIDYHTQAKRAGVDTTQRLAKEHLILIPDKHTQQFPLESLPYLRPQSVSRLPCISFLRDRILHGLAQKNKTSQHVAEEDTQNNTAWQDITIDASRTYYVLNPSGDLKYTQSKFENVFSR
jgi:separase